MSLRDPRLGALLPLARIRYPDVPPLLALEFYLSDRRYSGLGALGGRTVRPRSTPVTISRSKTRDMLKRTTTWSIRNHRLAWEVLPREAFEFDWSTPIGVGAESTFTTTILPELTVERWLTMPDRDIQDRDGRQRAAHYLRKLRAEVRKEWPANGGLP